MNVLTVSVLGGLAGVGLITLAAGCRGIAIVDLDRIRNGRFGQYVDQLLLRCGLALGGAVLLGGFSGWMLLGLVGLGIGWWLPSAAAMRGGHARELAVVEAIATWTEQIRDTLAAANGLEHALGATAVRAPAAIAPAVERLAARSDYERLSDALRRFADEVDHPLADFVVAALIIASEKQARDVGALLGHLADSARDEAQMLTRVWVGRARSRSAVRIIVVVVLSFVVGLLLLNREYLRPYDSGGGQLVLAGIIALFASSFIAMHHIARMTVPDRFVARRAEDAL